MGRLEALLDGRAEEELRRRPAPGEWSAKEITCHLRDAGEIYGERLRRVASEERPFLAAYDEQAYARDRNYQQAESAELAPAFRAHRERALAVLAQLSPADWQRTAVHEQTGEMTLTQIAVDVAYHEAMHLRDLARLLEGVTEGA